MAFVRALQNHPCFRANLARASQYALRVLMCTCCSALLLTSLAACTTAPAGSPVVDEDEAKLPPKVKSMRVVSSFGGVHRKLEIVQGVWFQAFSNRLLFLDAKSGTVLADLEVAPRGTTGSIHDFVLGANRAFVVLDGDAVVEVDTSVVREPVIVSRWGVPELGIVPKHVALIDGETWVSGDGGVVRLRDALPEGVPWNEDGEKKPRPQPKRFLEGKNVGMVIGAAGGPVACVGRRITRVSDGTYLGAASKLIDVPEQYGGGYGFVLQTGDGAQVGLMGPDFRERSSSAVRGVVHAIRILDDRFFAVNDYEVATWKFEKTPGTDSTVHADGTASEPHEHFVLGALLSVPVKGALDVGKVQRNRFAVSGTFGRALYRYLPEGDQPGDTFYWTERVPGRLDVSVSDRRRILASSREGSWLYLIGEKAELTDKPIASPDRPLLVAETSWGTATTSENREEVRFNLGEGAQITSQTYIPEGGARVSTLAIADGRVWIGHERGIDVIGFDPVTSEIVAEDRIRLSGPIIALYPNRVGGGVAYVAQYSGFGVIRPVNEDAPPIVTPGCVDGAPKKERGANGAQKNAGRGSANGEGSER
jgi:hypothetical protein